MSEAANTATIETPEQTPDSANGEAPADACKKCGLRNQGSCVTVCPKCGYYAALDRFVEVDPWQTGGEDGRAEQQSVSHLEVWAKLVPVWSWWIVGSVSLIVAESILANQVTPADSLVRTCWSLTQLAAGLLAFATVHVMIYVAAIMQADKFGLLDIVLRPVALWLPTLRGLPKGIKRVTIGASGLTAVLMSLLVIGGIPYEVLWNWKVEKRAQPNLIGAVLDQAKNADGNGEEDLEGAINAFAGEDEETAQEALPEEPRIEVDCVIVGFTRSRRNPEELGSLVLASTVDGKLKVVGLLSQGIEPEMRAELSRQLARLRQDQPFVETSLTAQWVKPKLTCRVTCKHQSTTGRLIDPRFESLMREIEF